MAIRLRQIAFVMSIVSMSLAGCATHIGAPQTREAFVSNMKSGGLFTNSETTIVRRPLNEVVADMKDYANKCLNVSVKRPANYAIREVGGITTYRSIISPGLNGGASLTLQEDYNIKFVSGAPPGGIFTFAAEIGAATGGQTQIDVYYPSGKGYVAESIKRWAGGDKRQCPNLP